MRLIRKRRSARGAYTAVLSRVRQACCERPSLLRFFLALLFFSIFVAFFPRRPVLPMQGKKSIFETSQTKSFSSFPSDKRGRRFDEIQLLLSPDRLGPCP